jgi:plasmid stability protein
MTDLHVHIPDEVAERLAVEAAQRGTSTEDVAAEVLSRYAPPPQGRSLEFIAMFDAPAGFDAQQAEELLETEGFVASS